MPLQRHEENEDARSIGKNITLLLHCLCGTEHRENSAMGGGAVPGM